MDPRSSSRPYRWPLVRKAKFDAGGAAKSTLLAFVTGDRESQHREGPLTEYPGSAHEI
jgi:hypothetical protein